MSLRKVKAYCLLVCVSSGVHALPSDKQQVMNVIADFANLSQQHHTGTYNGHVEFVQGTTHIHAAKAVTEGNDKNQLTLAKAEGTEKNPAHYWTQTDPKKPLFHAYADTISYYPLRHLIELKGNARIEQGDDSLSAAIITYDTEKQQVLTQRVGSNRTLIIFHPKKVSQ